jgi:Ca2+-binding EF-hand superfamily protein
MKQFWRRLLNIITLGLLDLRLAKCENIKNKLENICGFIDARDINKDGYISVNELWNMLKDLYASKGSTNDTNSTL